MDRSGGAKTWALVLSELAEAPVTVAWERPAWRVRWQDGPTREALMERAQALGRYRVGAPLPVEQLRFARSSSGLAIALGWLRRGSPGTPADGAAAAVDVQDWCTDTGYPQDRFDEPSLSAADLLHRVGHGNAAEMGVLLARASPPVAPHPALAAGPALTGRVVSIRWPSGGPPADLLAPTASPARDEDGAPVVTCERCGRPVTVTGRGRPAKYCSGACRTAAHRARRRPHPDVRVNPHGFMIGGV